MVRVRDLAVDDARALTDLYEEYDWWSDRDVDGVRKALSETEVAVYVEDDGEFVAATRMLTEFTLA